MDKSFALLYMTSPADVTDRTLDADDSVEQDDEISFNSSLRRAESPRVATPLESTTRRALRRSATSVGVRGRQSPPVERSESQAGRGHCEAAAGACPTNGERRAMKRRTDRLLDDDQRAAGVSGEGDGERRSRVQSSPPVNRARPTTLRLDNFDGSSHLKSHLIRYRTAKTYYGWSSASAVAHLCQSLSGDAACVF